MWTDHPSSQKRIEKTHEKARQARRTIEQAFMAQDKAHLSSDPVSSAIADRMIKLVDASVIADTQPLAGNSFAKRFEKASRRKNFVRRVMNLVNSLSPEELRKEASGKSYGPNSFTLKRLEGAERAQKELGL